MKRKLKTPPNFSSEAAERAFWANHDSTQYVDWSAAKRVQLAKLCRNICWTASGRSPTRAMYPTSR